MGEMKKELVMVFNGQIWDYVFDVSKSINLNLDTNEKAIEFINLEMSNINFTIDMEGSMMFIITSDEIPCVNCQ